MKLMKWVNTFIFFIFGISVNDADHFNDEARLRHRLFVEQKVNNLTRPVQYDTETLIVSFDLAITHVADLDETSEVLTLNCWVLNAWTDLHFKWNPSEFGGINFLPVSTSSIWTPDIFLFNSATSNDFHAIGEVRAVITSWGKVWWYPPATYRSVCPLDLRAFPFDEQICRLMFVSWTHMEDELKINMMSVNQSLTMFMSNEHNEWEIVSSHGNISNFSYPDFPEYSFNVTTYYIHLRRRAPYYRLALMVPCLVTMMATLALFWVPPTAGEKFFIASMNILSLIILLIHLYWVLPRTGSNIPAIVLFCGSSLLFAGISLIISVITTSLCHRSPKSAPPVFVLNFLSNGLVSTMLCLQSGVRKISYTGNAQLLSIEEEEEAPELSTNNFPFEWLKLAVAIDRLCFLIYCVIFMVILSVSFG